HRTELQMKREAQNTDLLQECELPQNISFEKVNGGAFHVNHRKKSADSCGQGQGDLCKQHRYLAKAFERPE
ncbi:hypothetical protein TNIN_110121, partial [Trichonephila inaurata madagascariensis]